MMAYGYIRCSGLGQMDGDGPLRQREAITRFAVTHNIQIVRWFEESHTGSDLEGRLVFREMRAELAVDGVRLVLVEKLDRLARSIMIQETIIADFKENAITLHSATLGEDDLCGDDPTRTLIRQIIACFFEYERKMIVLKTRAARERIRASGQRCEGRKRFGHHAPEMLIVETIQRLSNQGVSCLDIASTLNDEGIPTRLGKKWHSGTVSKILSRQRNTSESQQTERELQ